MCDEENLNALILDKNFQKLHRQLSRFNIFNATSMSDWEIKHTQFLGFLLDPNESHGLKEEFLFRFLQMASAEVGGGIPIVDFNLSYAQVFKEWYRAGRKIDLLLEIPSLARPEKTYIFVIENKINAGQAVGQLAEYRGLVEDAYSDEKFKKYYLYLTVSDEAPEDDGWHSVNYSNNILAVIEGILVDFYDTISEYMKSILGDYKDLIYSIQDEESGLALDSVVESIPVRVLEEAQRLAVNSCPEDFTARMLKIRYRRALEFLRDYDLDIRAAMLKHFKAKKELFSGLGIDSSDKTYLRLTFLSEDVERTLDAICQNPTRPWLRSGRHMAFELVLGRPVDHRIDCRVKLVLGPTGIDYTGRKGLVGAMREVIPGKHNRLNHFSNHFTTLCYMNFDEYSKVIGDKRQGIAWINETIEKISREKELLEGITSAVRKFLPPPQ